MGGHEECIMLLVDKGAKMEINELRAPLKTELEVKALTNGCVIDSGRSLSMYDIDSSRKSSRPTT